MTSDIENSIASTGRRHFIVGPSLYPALADQAAASRGWPDQYTERALPDISEMPKDAIGNVLVSQEKTRFTEGDDAMIDPFLGAGITEITYDAYQAAMVVEGL